MRCIACNEKMSDADLLRKNPYTQEYDDMCGRCLAKLREAELPHSIRYEADADCISSMAWLESLCYADFTAFEHDFKIRDKNKAI